MLSSTQKVEKSQLSLCKSSQSGMAKIWGMIHLGADQAEYTNLTELRISEFGASDTHEMKPRIANIALGLKKKVESHII